MLPHRQLEKASSMQTVSNKLVCPALTLQFWIEQNGIFKTLQNWLKEVRLRIAIIFSLRKEEGKGQCQEWQGQSAEEWKLVFTAVLVMILLL